MTQQSLSAPMFDRDTIFDPMREWCYSPHSSVVIGLPFVPEPVQITWDGAIYTRYAELAFFYGRLLTPVCARQKTFLNGWLPVIQYEWRQENIYYKLEIFSSAMLPSTSENCIQFTRLTMKNTGTVPVDGVIAAGIRLRSDDFRLGKPHYQLSPETVFEQRENALYRDGRLLYSFTPEPQAVSKCQWTTKGMDEKSIVGMTAYRRRLIPEESFHADFMMPRIPLDNHETIEQLQAADYERHRAAVISFWEELLDRKAKISIPEKRVNDSWRAALTHLILATRQSQEKEKRQGSGLPYDQLFLNDYADMRLAYDVFDLRQFSDVNVSWLLRKQTPSGMFVDHALSHDAEILTSHGQALFSLAHHYLMTRDVAYAAEVYPFVLKGAQWILRQHYENANGLLPPSIPYDNEMIKGCYTSHNLWALLGLRSSIRMADLLHKNEDRKELQSGHDSYLKAVQPALSGTFARHGYIAAGLGDFIFGPAAREGFADFRTNQDWENNLLAYPSETLSPDDPMLSATLAEIRHRKYREGCMTYRNGQHIHQYITINQAHQYLLNGNQRLALLDYYHVLLHNGSAHEGFENLVVPWSDCTPDASCPPPHAWAAAKTALFTRNMLLLEYGGRAGIEPEQRDLRLFNLISPSWNVPGAKVEIINCPCEMGKVSACLTFTGDGAEIKLSCDFHTPPRNIVIPVPYFVELQEVTPNASIENNLMCFSPDTEQIFIRWQALPAENNFQEILMAYRSEYGFTPDFADYSDPAKAPCGFILPDEFEPTSSTLGFDLVKAAFTHEYRRRFRKYLADGGIALNPEPPPLSYSTGEFTI